MRLMKRHEWWRKNYRDARDLDHLSPEQLSERLSDLMNNSSVRTERGKIGLLPHDQGGQRWLVWITELFEECVLRGYEYPGPINISSFRTDARLLEPIPNMADVITKYDLSPKKAYLLKIGDPFWLRQSLEKGTFRVASASFYDSNIHNHARRDSELKRQLTPSPRNARVLEFMASRGGQPPSGKVLSQLSIEAPTDYYLFSLSAAYSSRLFGDFHSTGCLVIYNPLVFLNRIAAAIKPHLSGYKYEIGIVTYFDPVRADPKFIDQNLRCCKSFRYAYQAEMRLTWTPPEIVNRLEPFHIEVGSLHDCAELVDIESYPPVDEPPDPNDAPIITYGLYKEDSLMINKLPDVAQMQGMLLCREAPNPHDWFFKIQYTDADEVWHEVKVPMLDGLYLLNMLREAEKNQHLDLWNRQ